MDLEEARCRTIDMGQVPQAVDPPDVATLVPEMADAVMKDQRECHC